MTEADLIELLKKNLTLEIDSETETSSVCISLRYGSELISSEYLRLPQRERSYCRDC